MNSFVLQRLIDILNDFKIPYDIIFIDQYVFVFPRKHENILKNSKIAFLEILGVVTFPSYNEFLEYEINKFFFDVKDLWFSDSLYQKMSNYIAQINLDY